MPSMMLDPNQFKRALAEEQAQDKLKGRCWSDGVGLGVTCTVGVLMALVVAYCAIVAVASAACQ